MDFEINSKYQQQLKDYVLLLLGAPCLKIELDDKQLDACIETAIADVESYFNKFESKNLSAGEYYNLVQRATLAKATLILSRIRGKYKGDKVIKLDAAELYKQSREDDKAWREMAMRIKSKWIDRLKE